MLERKYDILVIYYLSATLDMHKDASDLYFPNFPQQEREENIKINYTLNSLGLDSLYYPYYRW